MSLYDFKSQEIRRLNKIIVDISEKLKKFDDESWYTFECFDCNTIQYVDENAEPEFYPPMPCENEDGTIGEVIVQMKGENFCEECYNSTCDYCMFIHKCQKYPVYNS